MDQLYYIYIIFSILFLLEEKSINILISYIGLIITLAIMLSYTEGINSIDGEYYSYILILVQVSALTILFGFIIMLFPSMPQPYNPKGKLFILLLITLSFLTFLKNPSISSPSFLEENLYPDSNNFLRKLGYILYTIDNYIFKLLILTIILLLAILSLFFLL